MALLQILEDINFISVQGLVCSYAKFNTIKHYSVNYRLKRIIKIINKDYKNVKGVLFPDDIHVANYERNEEIKYTNISANVPVESSIFEMPPKTK